MNGFTENSALSNLYASGKDTFWETWGNWDWLGTSSVLLPYQISWQPQDTVTVDANLSITIFDPSSAARSQAVIRLLRRSSTTPSGLYRGKNLLGTVQVCFDGDLLLCILWSFARLRKDFTRHLLVHTQWCLSQNALKLDSQGPRGASPRSGEASAPTVRLGLGDLSR